MLTLRRLGWLAYDTMVAAQIACVVSFIIAVVLTIRARGPIGNFLFKSQAVTFVGCVVAFFALRFAGTHVSLGL